MQVCKILMYEKADNANSNDNVISRVKP